MFVVGVLLVASVIGFDEIEYPSNAVEDGALVGCGLSEMFEIEGFESSSLIIRLCQNKSTNTQSQRAHVE